MSLIERFDTATVTPRERLDFWNQLAWDTYPGTCIDSDRDTFHAQMLRWDLGDLAMIRPRAPAVVVQRWQNETPQGPEKVVLHLQHRGASEHRQRGRVAELRAGDFSLCSAIEPYRLDLSPGHEFLVVELPRAAIAQRIPDLDTWLSRTIPGTTPSTRMLHNFLLSLWQQGDQSQSDRAWQQGVADVLLDLIGLAVRGAEAFAPAQGPLAQRVLALIEARLCDPDLGTAALAEELGVSTRTVQNVFAAMRTTPSFYILGRRLRSAADRLLADPDKSITAIAYDVGFNDSAYFARCFRQHLGMSPSAYRLLR